MKEFCLKDERERISKLLRDRIRSLHFEDRFVIEQWIGEYFGNLRKQDKEFIKILKEDFKKRNFMEVYDEGNSFLDFVDKLTGDLE